MHMLTSSRNCKGENGVLFFRRQPRGGPRALTATEGRPGTRVSDGWAVTASTGARPVWPQGHTLRPREWLCPNSCELPAAHTCVCVRARMLSVMQIPKPEDKTQGKGLLIIINALTCSRAAVCPPPGLFIVRMKDGAFNYTDTEGCSRLGLGEGRLEPLIASVLLIARVPIILMVIKIMTLKSLHLHLHHWAHCNFFI